MSRKCSWAPWRHSLLPIKFLMKQELNPTVTGGRAYESAVPFFCHLIWLGLYDRHQYCELSRQCHIKRDKDLEQIAFQSPSFSFVVRLTIQITPHLQICLLSFFSSCPRRVKRTGEKCVCTGQLNLLVADWNWWKWIKFFARATANSRKLIDDMLVICTETINEILVVIFLKGRIAGSLGNWSDYQLEDDTGGRAFVFACPGFSRKLVQNLWWALQLADKLSPQAALLILPCNTQVTGRVEQVWYSVSQSVAHYQCYLKWCPVIQAGPPDSCHLTARLAMQCNKQK